MTRATQQIHSPADEPVDQAILERQAQSVGHLFRDRVAASPDRPAFLHAVVHESGDEWVSVTWRELDEVVRELGAGIVALGVDPEDRVAIASGTRYEWIVADLAIMVRRGRDDDDLPDDDRRRRRLHPQRLRARRSSSPRTRSSSRSCARSGHRRPACTGSCSWRAAPTVTTGR